MKKFIPISVGIILAMSLVACGNSKKDAMANPTTETVTEAVVENADEKSETTEAATEDTTEDDTEATESSEEAPTEQQGDNASEMLTEDEANQALTNYIYETHGKDFGKGTNCYWFVGPLKEGKYTGELHSYTGTITYFYIDASTGETDICELLNVNQEPTYVETVNFMNYK